MNCALWDAQCKWRDAQCKNVTISSTAQYTTIGACNHLASATIAASSLLASAFTSGAAADGGAAMAGVGAAMTASAACSPASFTEGVLALQLCSGAHHVADQLKSKA
jgi:hypothetical protein